MTTLIKLIQAGSFRACLFLIPLSPPPRSQEETGHESKVQPFIMVTERRRDGPGLTEVLFYPFPPGKSPGDSLAHQAGPAGGKGALNTETQTRFDPSQLHDV